VSDDNAAHNPGYVDGTDLASTVRAEAQLSSKGKGMATLAQANEGSIDRIFRFPIVG
jgi:hypothetical protein